MTEPVPLPQVLADIQAIIGRQAMWTLVAAHGGRTIYIPATMTKGHALAKLLGFEAAAALSLHYRDTTADLSFVGRKLLIPMASAAQQRAAWQETLDAGLSLPEIAARMGVHERTALRHRSAARKQDEPSLF
jgi:hypothetical protein